MKMDKGDIMVWFIVGFAILGVMMSIAMSMEILVAKEHCPLCEETECASCGSLELCDINTGECQPYTHLDIIEAKIDRYVNTTQEEIKIYKETTANYMYLFNNGTIMMLEGWATGLKQGLTLQCETNLTQYIIANGGFLLNETKQ